MMKKCISKSIFMSLLGASLLLGFHVSANPVVWEDVDEAEELLQSTNEQENNDNLIAEPQPPELKQELPNTSGPVVLPPCDDYPSCFPSVRR